MGSAAQGPVARSSRAALHHPAALCKRNIFRFFPVSAFASLVETAPILPCCIGEVNPPPFSREKKEAKRASLGTTHCCVLSRSFQNTRLYASFLPFWPAARCGAKLFGARFLRRFLHHSMRNEGLSKPSLGAVRGKFSFFYKMACHFLSELHKEAPAKGAGLPARAGATHNPARHNYGGFVTFA